VIDGTTITLAPTDPLVIAYPPATNQHGQTVWPVLMLMVAHELQSGCALIPELGAMYGPNRTSEAEQAAALARRIPKGSIVLADAGLGIFSVAHALDRAGHEFLMRLSKSRFQALARRAQVLAQTPTSGHWRLTWTPSLKDRNTNPDLPADAALEVFLHAVQLPDGQWLYLVTTLPLSSADAAAWYSRRYDVEHDIRDLKVTLGVEKIRAQSVAMVHKELWCSVVAYNLVLQLRREAAQVAGVEPRQLSFTGVWTTMRVRLLQQPPCPWQEWQERYEQAVRQAALYKLPNRPGRSYPRRAHPRRPKSTKFMHQSTKKSQSPTIPEKPK
jgi:hypothetical protein